MNSIAALIICSIVVQFIVERLKPIIPDKGRKYSIPIVTLIAGIVIAFSTQIGLFQTIGMPLAYINLDYIFTGIAYSGGSAAINELIKTIMESRPSNYGKGDD